MSDFSQPETTPQTKAIMSSLKFYQYSGQRIPNWTNPDSWYYWSANWVLTAALLVGYYKCKQIKGPRSVFTIPLILIPVMATLDRKNLDSNFKPIGGPLTIEERLEYTPMARNAWYAALQENKKFQDKLMKSIQALETELNVSSEEQ
jgi:hypothetical protein